MRTLALFVFLPLLAHAQPFPSPPTGLQIWTPPLSPAPTPTSVAAATNTAKDNALCLALPPFYWEIGDGVATRAFGSVGTPIVQATTRLSIASASKIIYGAYVTQLRGSAASLTTADILHLHMLSGYTSIAGGGACSGFTTVNNCLANDGYANQTSANIGKFFYDGGHDENHASLYTSLGNLSLSALTAAIRAQLNVGTQCLYTQPLLPGGLFCSANDVTVVLRAVVANTLVYHDALGLDEVCTLPGSSGCNAVSSPIPEAWHYTIGAWVEDDPASNGDGAFSSPGSFGFYPWIDASKSYYGVVSVQTPSGGQGFASAQCGRLIRRAWFTGNEQTGNIPTS